MQIVHAMAGLVLACLLVAESWAKSDCPPPPAMPTPAQMQEAQKNAVDHGFLWRISKSGHTSYLYGTIHVAKFEWMFPGPRVMQALKETDAMALELDVLDQDLQKRTAQGMKAMRNTPLSESVKERLRKLAESYCVPYENIAGLPPELQIATLETFMGQKNGLRPEYAIDAMLAMVGHKSGKQVVSLETPEFQLAQLQMAIPEETIAMVEDDLDMLDRENGLSYMVRVAKIWGDSDYEEMANFPAWCKCMDTEIERKIMKRLLDDRNPAMAKRIDELHVSGKNVFTAVGSLHMFGEQGLPLLMEKMGYKVERIRLNGN